MIYSSCDVECDRLKFIIMGNFLPFYPPPPLSPPLRPSLKPKKSEFWKNEKNCYYRDIIILHICTKNYNHMRYGSWNTKWDRHNFLSFWAISALYPLSPNNLENQNFENMKKGSGMSSFYTCVPKITIIWCILPQISF